jgi:hypothetical protein
VLARYPDGSYLSQIGATQVRVVTAEITIATSTGRATGVYRLATTLLDHHRYPALGWSRSTTNAGRSKPPTWS